MSLRVTSFMYCKWQKYIRVPVSEAIILFYALWLLCYSLLLKDIVHYALQVPFTFINCQFFCKYIVTYKEELCLLDIKKWKYFLCCSRGLTEQKLLGRLRSARAVTFVESPLYSCIFGNTPTQEAMYYSETIPIMSYLLCQHNSTVPIILKTMPA